MVPACMIIESGFFLIARLRWSVLFSFVAPGNNLRFNLVLLFENISGFWCWSINSPRTFTFLSFCNGLLLHCVKSVQIRSFFWSVFSCIRIEYGPEITPYLDTFHAVWFALQISLNHWIVVKMVHPCVNYSVFDFSDVSAFRELVNPFYWDG